MAFIRVGVAAVTGEATGSDAAAQEVLNHYIAAKGGPVNGTNKQKLDWIAASLKKIVVDTATDYRRNQAADEARQAVDDAPSEF